jgi:hypothetical protein
VKKDYCRKHHITIAELSARMESDDQLVAELYRLAQAAKLTRPETDNRPVSLVRRQRPGTASSLLPAPYTNGARTGSAS